MSLWSSLAGLFAAIGQLFQPTPPVPPPPSPPKPPWVPPQPPEPNSVLIELLIEHNNARRDVGVQPLTTSEALNRAAQKHADWMAANRNMNHSEVPGTPDFDAVNFSQRIQREQYRLSTGGENIAAGQRSAQEVMDAWMHSPGHKANILNPDYWNVGFGVATDTFGHIYWCTVFATPMTRAVRVQLVRVQIIVSLPRAIVRG